MNDPINLFGLSTSLLELLSFFLALVTVAFNIRQIHWAWLFSIISSALYAWVFFAARLYGDMGLQAVFIAVSLWGWVSWRRGVAERIAVTRLALGARWLALLSWGLAFFVLARFLAAYTDTDVPHVDGFLTAGSLLGQVLLSRKKIENWQVWIVVDVLYVGLYIYKNLLLTAVLYAIFVILAVVGWRSWSRVCQTV
ncbi:MULTISPECIES: nicotinamide riboside transporter PnuC [unclassified Undibacterium]|uniref:nicotinamide riboside transporter PnuC n=1 Tax=unclassified Undibacterium TaxID=2630295 RepID=UPI002AC940A5|nr:MULTISPECIES: nicotinamide riboside transporter PnuC [unclassified Undibacterium]MEB0139203.1 nicotinamide riboside transporter PnuC [Undibacterium sp. CCC2.1]MEB0172222.1 nicotinamide riboside transporter PnuC [Undibacterium sp. CCC1.1]MEB0175921.1 nicotinamide riboside transporter PnuC [Undibacterium sp. CCC3.4]MEB0215219.1 nicotinamide riboside transporter PnuC [Undibacterium sp. 5I2]WPX43517.1 nicotinamide riboside transporter PnuC [Undibacterium sp. CCC3.4]